jgi:hypothetical protein
MMADDARISTALPRHPKTVKIQRQLGATGCWSLVCLFLWAAENRPDGDLRGMSAEDIAIAANWPETPGDFVRTLADVRFLDGQEAGYRIHDWAEHNPYVASRPQRAEAARLAAEARWKRTTPEQRAAAGRQAANARWKDETASDGKPDASGMHAEGTHDACGMRAACVPPSLPYPTKPKNNLRAKRVALPEGFGISDQTRAWALEKGFDRLEERLEHFVGYARANAKTYADWDQAFRNAVRDDWARLKQRGNGSGNGAQPAKRKTVNPADIIRQQEAEGCPPRGSGGLRGKVVP